MLSRLNSTENLWTIFFFFKCTIDPQDVIFVEVRDRNLHRVLWWWPKMLFSSLATSSTSGLWACRTLSARAPLLRPCLWFDFLCRRCDMRRNAFLSLCQSLSHEEERPTTCTLPLVSSAASLQVVGWWPTCPRHRRLRLWNIIENSLKIFRNQEENQFSLVGLNFNPTKLNWNSVDNFFFFKVHDRSTGRHLCEGARSKLA